MKNYIHSAGNFLKTVLFDDLANRYLFSFSLLLSVIDYLIWHFKLSSPDLFVYVKFNIYPIKFLAIILVLNTFLALSSYRKEKEICYLLLIGNIVVAVLMFILEIYYLSL